MTNKRSLTIGLVTRSLCRLVVIIPIFAATALDLSHDYGIVLDAGSSHTEVTLYRWKADRDRCKGTVEEIDTCKVDGGISGYDLLLTGESAIAQDLLRCVRNVSAKIFILRPYLTPLYLGATAGMRALNDTSPDTVHNILHLIRRVLHSHTKFQVKTTDIISGAAEGMLSWVTANYLLDNLHYNDDGSPTATDGMLDMGGKSAQIAYGTGNKTADTVTIQICGLNHTVRTSSNMCFGTDLAILRYQMYLIATAANPYAPIDSPCLPIGATITVAGTAFKNQMCLKTKKPIITDYTKVYVFKGVSRSDDCSAIIADHLLSTTSCADMFDMCLHVEDSPPPVGTQFYALSNYYYMASVLNLTVTTAEIYRQKSTELCSLNRESLLKNPLVSARYVDAYCFKFHYIYTTIKHVYKFADNQWPHIKFSANIHGQPLGWSLGYMINATKAIAPKGLPLVLRYAHAFAHRAITNINFH